MRAAIAIAVLAAGCTRILGVHDFPPEVPDLDAGPIDAPSPPADAQVCFGPYNYCFASPPSGSIVLSGTLDPSSDPRCDPATTAVCLIGGRDIVINSFTLTGTRPLALVGRTIQVDGAVTLGKIAGSATCVAPTAAASQAGAAGGSYGTMGGNGGASQSGPGGTASAAAIPTALRGGCAGAGASGSHGLTAGALGLIATAQITVSATSYINACGAGGLGGSSPQVGGGGGGSGGMVLLDAPAIQVDGSILALGGGGGAGSTLTSAGISGTSGCTSVSSIAAPGGSGPNGKGGDGATTGAGGAGLPAGNGAGGGGGGAGVILVRGATSGAGMVIPAKTSIGP